VRSLTRICFSYGRVVDGITAGGARRDRTDDLLLAKQALSQLSYGPAPRWACQPKLAETALAPPLRASPGSLYSLRERRLVGLGRFELPTSRLSSARSNQLSYRPMKHTLVPRDRKDRGQRMLQRPWIAWARPRRKRNVDGEIPPKDMPILKLACPDVFLSDPITRSGCFTLKDHP
jgi:hypothetical protein